MLEAAHCAARFQHLKMSHEIGANIGARLDQRIAHARLRRQVHDAIDVAMLCCQLRKCATLGDVQTLEAEARRFPQLGEARFLEPHVVIGAQIVDAQHALAGARERSRHVKSDEAGSAGDENGHEPVAEIGSIGLIARVPADVTRGALASAGRSLKLGAAARSRKAAIP